MLTLGQLVAGVHELRNVIQRGRSNMKHLTADGHSVEEELKLHAVLDLLDEVDAKLAKMED